MTDRKFGFLAALALVLAACGPSTPDAVPPPTASAGCTVTGDHNSVNCGSGNQTVTVPSPSPSPSPGSVPANLHVVKITQFGEACPAGIQPSGQDRAVRVGCTKALTLSPKCFNPVPGQPDMDCPVSDNAAPDSFEVVSGGEFIDFLPFSGASAMELRAFSGPHTFTAAFNRIARGKRKGFAVISGAYAGIPAEPFVLEVVE